jgi:hypothetical protein
MRSLGINWSKSHPSSCFIIHHPLRPKDKPGKEKETIYLMLSTSQLSRLSKPSKSSSCSISCFNVDQLLLLRDLRTYGTLLSLLHHNEAGLSKRRITLSSAQLNVVLTDELASRCPKVRGGKSRDRGVLLRFGQLYWLSTKQGQLIDGPSGPVGDKIGSPCPPLRKVSLTQGLTRAHAAQGGVTLGT